MSKPRDEQLSQVDVVALRNAAIAMGMENDDATELFVANNDRESTARGLEEWTRNQ